MVIAQEYSTSLEISTDMLLFVNEPSAARRISGQEAARLGSEPSFSGGITALKNIGVDAIITCGEDETMSAGIGKVPDINR